MSARIAIILARGGSKRLPRKNVIDFFGKPMLAWSIEAALESNCFQRVLVSTDDPQIAAIAIKHGAEAPFLREVAADDMSSSSEATIVALEQAERHWKSHYKVVAQLMANCPMRTAKDIKTAFEHFDETGARAQISSFRFGWMNPWWAAQIDTQGTPEYLFPAERMARSQDLPALYCPSGALWIAKRDALLVERTFYASGHVFHQLNWMSAMDIDDAEDLAIARACFLARSGSPDDLSGA